MLQERRGGGASSRHTGFRVRAGWEAVLRVTEVSCTHVGRQLLGEAHKVQHGGLENMALGFL